MLQKQWLLVVLAALTAHTTAFNLEDIHINGINQYLHHGEKRQASGTGAASPTPTPQPSSNPPPSSAPPTEPTPTPTPDEPSTDPTTPAPAPSTPQPQPSSNAQSPTGPQTSNNNNNPSPTSARPASSTPRTTAIVRTTDLVSTSLQEFITRYTTVNPDGQQIEVTSTGTSSIVTTTGRAVVTDPPTTQEGSGGSGGLSDSNKKVIGGVVGGVGAILLLGGIGLVFWRMKKRQGRVHEDDDDLMAGTGAALGDKSHNNNMASPFQSNLEQYHNPGGRPNAAANF